MLFRLFYFLCIVNNKYPICKNCKHFTRIKVSEYNTNELCMKYGIKNLVTGNISNYSADICRQYNDLCGLEGKSFTPNEMPTDR